MKIIKGCGQGQSNVIQPVNQVVQMQYYNKASLIMTKILLKYQRLTERIYIPDDEAFYRNFLAESSFLQGYGEILYYLYDRLYALSQESISLGMHNFYNNFFRAYPELNRRFKRFIFFQFGRHIQDP